MTTPRAIREGASADGDSRRASGRSPRHRTGLIEAGLGVTLGVLVVVSFALGRYPVTVQELFSYLGSLITSQPTRVPSGVVSIIRNARFPRIAGSVLIGAALAMAGASYQGVFRNPMAAPDILGASAGAGFGASLGILLGYSNAGVQIISFAFGILAVSVTYLISRTVGRHDNTTLVLVLGGMVVGALFQALVSMVKYVADPYSQLPEITFWLMGGLTSFETSDIITLLVPLVIGFIGMFALRWRVNVLAFGDDEARALGVNVDRLRLVIIICATLVTSATVSVAGQIGWVGLIIPHFARMLVGPDYRRLMPTSLLMGACYLLVVDDIARNLLQTEIPLGILTAIIGAPIFIMLLLRGRRRWS